MSGFLLDTNCISEIVRVRPEPRVRTWMNDADENVLYLSVLTLGEIRKGNVEVAWKHGSKWNYTFVSRAGFCRVMNG
jgi:predicted nucleic acid-binding protein